VVCVNIDLLLLDVRLAILSIRKSAATNLARLAYCIPAILMPRRSDSVSSTCRAVKFVMMIVPVFQRLRKAPHMGLSYLLSPTSAARPLDPLVTTAVGTFTGARIGRKAQSMPAD